MKKQVLMFCRSFITLLHHTEIKYETNCFGSLISINAALGFVVQRPYMSKDQRNLDFSFHYLFLFWCWSEMWSGHLFSFIQRWIYLCRNTGCMCVSMLSLCVTVFSLCLEDSERLHLRPVCVCVNVCARVWICGFLECVGGKRFLSFAESRIWKPW